MSYRTGWNEKFTQKFGLLPVRYSANAVIEAKCQFCSSFGGEETKTNDENEGGAHRSNILLGVSAKKRKKTKRIKYFTSFRVDNIQQHIKNEHPMKYAEYESSTDKKSFLSKKFWMCSCRKRRELSTSFHQTSLMSYPLFFATIMIVVAIG